MSDGSEKRGFSAWDGLAERTRLTTQEAEQMVEGMHLDPESREFEEARRTYAACIGSNGEKHPRWLTDHCLRYLTCLGEIVQKNDRRRRATEPGKALLRDEEGRGG